MTKNELKLNGSDVDELCNIVLEYVRGKNDGWTEIRSLKTRFNIDYDSADGFITEPTLKRSVQDIMYQINGRDENFYEFLSYMADNDDSYTSQYQTILKKYGYSIEENSGKNIIVPLTGETFEKEVNELTGFIENNAPKKTLDHMIEAKEKFARGDFDGCIGECRSVLESMTLKSFAQGIEELARRNLINDADDKSRKDDGWILKSIYGYSSTIGSHSTASSSNANSEQAFMTLMITQSSVRYLLKKLQEAKRHGIKLQEWVQL